MDEAHEFERRLGRLFDAAPELPDAVLFAAQVQRRLERKDAVRRAVLGLAGGVGAFVAAAELVRANLGVRLSELGGATSGLAAQATAALDRRTGGWLSASPLTGEVVWTVAGLAAVALALIAARAADRV